MKTQKKLKSGILKVLAYFDLFDYPLLVNEIHFMMDRQVDRKELLAGLDELDKAKCLFRFGEFYTLNSDPDSIEKRLKGNERAKPLLVIAGRIAGFLFRFPFVRAIAISGSLSKNYAEPNADIDLFIITKANRLWIARTILHLFKKLTYLTGHQHWYCMNYFIDEEALLIEEKNIFTATEVITLRPIYGKDTMELFIRANEWVNMFFPNYEIGTMDCPGDSGNGAKVKKTIEALFNNKLGDRLDNYFRKITSARWTRKEENHQLNMKGNRMGLRMDKHFSKPNPVYFQEKLLNRYRKNYDKWEQRWTALGVHDPSPFFLKEII
jgi:hypothetical protein